MSIGDAARKKLRRSSDGDEYRQRGIVLEAALLALMLRRRNAAKTDSGVVSAIADAIVSGRQSARELGRESVAAVAPVSDTVSAGSKLADRIQAQRIARNHLDLVQRAERNARIAGIENPRTEAFADTEYHLRTVAASETFQAATDEVIRAAQESAAAGVSLEKRWNAEGDPCEECEPMHGEQVGFSEDFSNGTEPGDVHANCHCWLEVVVP